MERAKGWLTLGRANDPKRAACTIIARNYIAQARLLASSYLRHHPDSHFFVLIVDGLPDGVDFGESVTILGPDDLSLPQFVEMAFKYEVTELSTAVKPSVMSTIMRQRDVEQLVYLDPDIVIFRPLEEMWSQLDSASILLIPHLLDPIPLDGNRPSEQDILCAGAYNLGFIGLRACSESDSMLAWWHERLIDLCRVDIAHGLFVDQKWMDLVPSLFAGTAVLRDETYDIAYWNLHSRHLERADDDILVSGKPLAFFHYSGFDPARPRELSKHQNRITVEGDSPLAYLLDQYSRAMDQAGHTLTRTWPYGYATFTNRVSVSHLHRSLYATLTPEQRRDFGNPFHAGSNSFFDWSSRPPSGPQGLSHLMEHLLAESLEARLAFPEASGTQHRAFLSWAQTHGVERFGYDRRLADPAAWSELQAAEADDGSTVPGRAVLGVNVVGYLKNETGLGAVARGFVNALRGLGLPLGLMDLAELSPNRSADASLGTIDGKLPYGINIVCVNADQHFVVKSHVGENLFRDHYNIGVWFWELPTFPKEWRDRFQDYDEIWACSSYVANTLAQISPIPVVRVPAVLTKRAGSRESGRRRVGVDDDTFVFLFIFDFASYFERKNPLATIEAFRRAFSPTDDVRLVIKCVNQHLDADAFASMQEQASRHQISIHTGYWTSDEMRDLMAACDAYVSLHRSEGLGLTISDAMAAGRPVIATGWSGNMDFMTVANSFPVAFDLVPITENVGPYPGGALWADPSADDAAHLMRVVRDENELARRRGEAARREIEEHFSESTVGSFLQTRLANAAARLKGRSRATQRVSAVHMVRPSGLEPPVVPPMDLGDSSHGRLGVLAKRSMNVLLRYHNHYQGELNIAFASFMRQLLADHDAQREELGATRELLGTTREELSTRLAGLANDVARLDSYFAARPYMGYDAYGTGGDLRQPMSYGHDAKRPKPSASVAAFEELFRGPADLITTRQRVYLRILEGMSRVVDLGSGRGEFLELLREAGIDGVGVELDSKLVGECRARGLTVECCDAYDYLAALGEASVDVIFSAQFIEHVESSRLTELVELSRSRLRDGGLFIAETVNPESYLAQKTFFVDLTHQRPIFPQVLLHICQTVGFSSARIFYPTAGGFAQTGYRDAGEYAVVAVK
jgi:glycosyltransferase involved in cell wall biosynthesis/SAM-dependent methyltransferase